MRSIDAEHVAELFRMFARVGLPREILTDQGTNFTSELLAEIYRLLHIDSLRTSPYDPQTDGLLERFNGTLKEMLRKCATEDGKDCGTVYYHMCFLHIGRLHMSPPDSLPLSSYTNEKSEAHWILSRRGGRPKQEAARV